MNSVFDDLEYIKRHDPAGMIKSINDFPKSALNSIENTKRIRTKIHGGDFDSILIAGMGASAIGGLLLRDWLIDTLKTPITVNRGYHLPAWANKNTLVYIVSYSGNTEETLNQYNEAIERGCSIVCFCSGGALEEKAKENAHPLVKFPKGHQPRAAIPFQFYNLAGITRKIGLINDSKWDEVSESITILETHCREMNHRVPMESNPGKKLADEIRGYIPIVYAPWLFRSVAERYSTQFNENSKSPSAFNFYPEVFHNSVMAREGNKELLKKLCIISILDSKGDERLNDKIDFSIELLKEAYCKTVSVNVRGESNLARMMSAVVQGDYTSYYLGLLYGVNPSTTETIRILKAGSRD